MYYVWSCYFGFSVIPKILAVEKKQPPTKLQVKTTDITSARANLPPSPVQELSPGKNATSQFSRENMSPRRRKSERGRPTTLSRVSGGTRKLWAAAEPRGPAAAAPSPPGPRAAEGRPGPEPRTCSTLPAPGQRQLCRGRASPRDGPGREQSSLGPDLPPPQEGAAKGDGERVLRSPPPESGASASPPPRGPTPARPPPPTPQPADRHLPGMHRAARRRARPATRPPAPSRRAARAPWRRRRCCASSGSAAGRSRPRPCCSPASGCARSAAAPSRWRGASSSWWRPCPPRYRGRWRGRPGPRLRRAGAV